MHIYASDPVVTLTANESTTKSVLLWVDTVAKCFECSPDLRQMLFLPANSILVGLGV